MTAYDDSLLAAQFAALAPEPLEGRWDDVLREAAAARDDGKRLERSAVTHGRRRYVVALVAAALILVVGTASAIGGIRDFILDRGLIGLPPEGAAPSTPVKGKLVMRWGLRPAPATRDGNYPTVRAWVYADGRIVWTEFGTGPRSVPESANELTSGYLEQRLAPEGVELMRSAITDLFDLAPAFVRTVPADELAAERSDGPVLTVPIEYGIGGGGVDIARGDRMYRLRWSGIDEGVGTNATPEQLSALRRVDALVTDPTSVLPPSAWAIKRIRAYVPSHYQVCMDTSPPKDASYPLSLLPGAAADVFRGKSLERSEYDLVEGREGGRTAVVGRAATYCAKLTTEEAREVARPFSGVDPDPRFHGVILGYRLAEIQRDPPSIWFEPYFPHGQVTCSVCA